MAGRGRGRGRGGLSFNIEALGIQRGDVISTPGLQPPPLFPPLQYKPIPLGENSKSQTYMLEVKQEMQVKFRHSPYYLTMSEKKRDIERYSDKYQSNQKEPSNTWKPDWNRFPAELKPKKKRKAKVLVQPNVKKARTVGPGSAEEVLSKWENWEKSAPAENADAEEEPGEDEEEKEDREDTEEEEEFEDNEEETDYNLTYFDNGENYGEDDEDEEEPAYS